MIKLKPETEQALVRARGDLAAYCKAMWPPFECAPHHRAIIDRLQALAVGAIDRLMIFLPPRHGKSVITSTLFPAWFLGRNPGASVISASYGAELSLDFGRRVRGFVDHDLHRTIFPDCRPLDDNLAAHRFGLTKGGTYFGVGVGGPITGRGADLFIIDDPIKSAEEAYSGVSRTSLKQWYEQVAYTRLQPGGRIVLIQTRWNMDDLAGWLLREHANDNWIVLSLPALAEPNDVLYRPEGAPLWPSHFSSEELSRIRMAIGSNAWSALYQQRPVVAEGAVFRRDWFHPYVDIPEVYRIIFSLDTAFKTHESSDYSVIEVWGENKTGYYLLDVVRERLDFPALQARAIAKAQFWHPHAVLIEDAASGQCYSDDTEVLTRRGWLRFADANIDFDDFATRDMATRQFQWQRATARTDAHYSGPMYRFYSSSLDLLVTPDHRMLVNSLPRGLGGNHHRTGDVIVEAERLAHHHSVHTRIPMTSVWEGQDIAEKVFEVDELRRSARVSSQAFFKPRKRRITDKLNETAVAEIRASTDNSRALARRFRVSTSLIWLVKTGRCHRLGVSDSDTHWRLTASPSQRIRMSGDDYCGFMGAYIAEGWYRYLPKNKGAQVFISQYPTSAAYASYAELCERITGRPAKHDGRDFRIGGRALVEFVEQYGKRAWDKFIPDDIMNASRRQLAIFWRYYMLGDGCTFDHPQRRGVRKYVGPNQTVTTTSKRLADQLTEIGQKLGYCASLSIREPVDTRAFGTTKHTIRKENCHKRYVVHLRYRRAISFHVERTHYDGIIRCVSVPAGVVYVRRKGKPAWCGQSLVQTLKVESRLPILPVKPLGDKTARASAVSPLFESGRIFVPQQAHWLADYLDEMTTFPASAHDDQVDATSQALAWLHEHAQISYTGYQSVNGPLGPGEAAIRGERAREWEEDNPGAGGTWGVIAGNARRDFGKGTW